MFVEGIVCNINVVFLRHSVDSTDVRHIECVAGNVDRTLVLLLYSERKTNKML